MLLCGYVPFHIVCTFIWPQTNCNNSYLIEGSYKNPRRQRRGQHKPLKAECIFNGYKSRDNLGSYIQFVYLKTTVLLKGHTGFPLYGYLRLASYDLRIACGFPDLRLATCDLRLATCDLRLATCWWYKWLTGQTRLLYWSRDTSTQLTSKSIKQKNTHSTCSVDPIITGFWKKNMCVYIK